jgi:hypothetical protein
MGVANVGAWGWVRRAAGGLVVLACAAGCGAGGPTLAERVPVSGRVVLASGKPLTKGRVTFVSRDLSAPPASGDLGPDGAFRLTTRDPGDGAVPGAYRVRIEPAAVPGARPDAVRLPFPAKYIDEDSSPLAVTVRGGPTELGTLRLK